jgi:hypothetical protein
LEVNPLGRNLYLFSVGFIFSVNVVAVGFEVYAWDSVPCIVRFLMASPQNNEYRPLYHLAVMV